MERPSRTNHFWDRWKLRLALFAMSAGPGIITANVDNDAGGIATYSVAGASFGYRFLWLMPVVGLLSGVFLEICSRTGVVTGKGLSAVIRERFGVKVSFYLMLGLIITNLTNVVANFAGVAAGAEILGIPRYLAVPVGAFILWRIIVKGTYRTAEKWFFLACAFYITYIISGFLARPDWSEALAATVSPPRQWDKHYLYLAVGITGATIAPWMQFYQQASTVEKGIPVHRYRYALVDVIAGAIMAMVIQWFIVMTCGATLYVKSIQIETAADAAQALAPIAGRYCALLFAIGLVTASYFGATIQPISTATSVCEAMGWERGLDRRFVEAPHYYFIFTLMIVIGATVALAAKPESLVPIMVFSQVVNGLLLPAVVFLSVRIASDKSVMGSYANGRVLGAIAWAGVAIITVMSLAMVVLGIAGV